MRLGLTLATSALPGDALQAAIAAEQAGVETIYVVERHFDPDAGFANPFAVAAALSACVQHAWIAVQPAIGLEHPLRIVEQSNALDVLTRGRCLIVLADAAEALQYDAFGLPLPGNGLLEDLLLQMEHAWAWQFHDDENAPPLEFQSGPFAARMAGRIMPSAYRTPRPLIARETDTEAGVREAARRGWALHLRHVADAEHLVPLYLEQLVLAGLSSSSVDALRDRVTVSVDTPEPSQMRRLAECGVAEVRVEASSEASFVEAALGVLKTL
jgi:alkanesulfonate monooxygenase SsuD/methylene tetrahydromethanopterin reductase-like flavin-dependent oxidoreductase (luciferase family)